MARLLDSRQLLNFVTLARTRSYTKAARELNLTQSAISHSIKVLERELGHTLVKRAGHTLLLTEKGETFCEEAEKIVEAMGQLRHRLDELGKWGRGRLRIGASVTACQHLLPAVLREFKQSFPECTITVTPGDAPVTLAALRQNKIDVGVVIAPEHSAEFELHPLFQDELRVIASPQYGWSQRKKPTIEDLANETLLTYTRGTLTFSQIEAYFARFGLRLQHTLEMGNMEAIKEMAKIGQGVGIVPGWLVQREVENGFLVSQPLPSERLYRKWALATLKGKSLSILEETFRGLAEEGGQALIGKTVKRFD